MLFWYSFHEGLCYFFYVFVTPTVIVFVTPSLMDSVTALCWFLILLISHSASPSCWSLSLLCSLCYSFHAGLYYSFSADFSITLIADFYYSLISVITSEWSMLFLPAGLDYSFNAWIRGTFWTPDLTSASVPITLPPLESSLCFGSGQRP